MDHDNSGKKNECIVCQNKFTRRSALYRHLRLIHKVEVEFAGRKHKFKCPDPECSLTFPLSEKLRNHIEVAHGVRIELCVKRFETFSDFEKWKDAVQDQLKSLYVSRQTKKSVGKNEHYYYICHRSGYCTSTSIGKRKSSTKKINGWCPSGMDVAVYWKEGVLVKFWMTHFGHAVEVDRLHLSRQEKLTVAKKLQDGVSFDKILDDVRDSLVDDDIRRIHLLSRKDIYNISRAFKISNKESLIQKEAVSISSWVESMKALGEDSPVIFYKEKESEHSALRISDFLLVIMTKVQQRVLEKCATQIVCIDNIKTSHLYNYHLITLMTIDEYDIGCPLAFCVSNKVDAIIISLFLNCIYSKVGIISAKIFMSPDSPLFYSTWEAIMEPVDVQLFCSWNVDKNWRKALEKLSCSEEKKIRAYKAMRQLMQEPVYDEFQSKLEETLQQLDGDTDMKNFSNYLKTKYLEKSKRWAFYYRSPQLLQYNMILEQIHRDLNECYAEGRSVNSFVRTLNLIMGFSRDKMLEKLEKLPDELQTDKLENVFQIQQEIQKIDVVKTQEISEKQLQVPTVEKDCCYVEHNVDKICPPNCRPICAVCNICFHRFTCTCIENIVNLDICRHIHASVNLMKSHCKHSERERNGETTLACNDMPVTREEIVGLTKEIGSLVNEESDMVMVVDEVTSHDENITDSDGDVEECDEESLKSLLLQKVDYINVLLKDTMFTHEEYKVLDKYCDEIIEFANGHN